jgi:hypothetical protein
VHWKELPTFIKEVFIVEKQSDLDVFDNDVRTSNFLQRKETSGHYSFVHKSFMEYFTAKYFYDCIYDRKADGLDELTDYIGSKVIFEFIVEMLTEEDKHFILQDIKRYEHTDYAKLMRKKDHSKNEKLYSSPKSIGNCIFLLVKAGITVFKKAQIDTAMLRGIELKNVSFDNASMMNTNFENCILENVKFNTSKLIGANFRGAKLKNVDFSNAEITKADLRNITLLGTTFSTIPAAMYWGTAKMDQALRKSLEQAYKKPSAVVTKQIE